MSITEKIRKWLLECPHIDQVETEHLPDEDEAVGIYKQHRNTIEKYVDGSELRTEYYYFLVKKTAQLEKERIDNDSFLGAIEDWIEAQEFAENYPDIEKAMGVEVATSFYVQEQAEEDAIYQIGIGVTYLKERK